MSPQPIKSMMRNRSVAGLNLGKKFLVGVGGMAIPLIPIAMLRTPAIRGQDAVDWQTKAGGKMSFEIASVKQDTGPFRSPNFPLDSGDAFAVTGGRFFADFALTTYISFAYKLSLTLEQSHDCSPAEMGR
jgi:hypothetical protein